jgi:putative transposase
MKRSKFTESQIVFALKQAETGVAVAEVCRKMGISEATFYNWKKKYGGQIRKPSMFHLESSREKMGPRWGPYVLICSLPKRYLDDR